LALRSGGADYLSTASSLMDLGAFLVGANLTKHGEGLAALGCTEVGDLLAGTD
jgi:hypothetical protein